MTLNDNNINNINIAIDGHSSCGKSTLAKQLAKALNYTYIDSGAMYRAVTLYFLDNKVDINNQDEVLKSLDHIQLDLSYPDGQFDIKLNGTSVTHKIISIEVSSLVSEVAAISSVRKKLVATQQALGNNKGVVMDGRDIGTVVFPDAELKLYVTAALDVRAQRRYDELKQKGLDTPLDKVSHNLAHRDNIDSTRADSPLKKATDAHLIDNSYMTREEQLHLALKLAKETILDTPKP